MNKPKETLEIKKLDENKFELKRTIIDEVTAEEFVGIHKQIEDAMKNNKDRLEQDKKRVADLETALVEEESVLASRMQQFEVFLNDAKLHAELLKKQEERKPEEIKEEKKE